jgi:hypothetical protein
MLEEQAVAKEAEEPLGLPVNGYPKSYSLYSRKKPQRGVIRKGGRRTHVQLQKR